MLLNVELVSGLQAPRASKLKMKYPEKFAQLMPMERAIMNKEQLSSVNGGHQLFYA